jgi:hypothetical protein
VQSCHLQGVDDQARAHVVGDLPPDDHPRGQVDHGRQIQPALTRAQVGDVTDQPGTRLLGSEVSLDQVDRILIINAVHGGNPGPPPVSGPGLVRVAGYLRWVQSRAYSIGVL